MGISDDLRQREAERAREEREKARERREESEQKTRTKERAREESRRHKAEIESFREKLRERLEKIERKRTEERRHQEVLNAMRPPQKTIMESRIASWFESSSVSSDYVRPSIETELESRREEIQRRSCPNCAEKVLCAARVCRFCNTPLEDQLEQTLRAKALETALSHGHTIVRLAADGEVAESVKVFLSYADQNYSAKIPLQRYLDTISGAEFVERGVFASLPEKWFEAVTAALEQRAYADAVSAEHWFSNELTQFEDPNVLSSHVQPRHVFYDVSNLISEQIAKIRDSPVEAFWLNQVDFNSSHQPKLPELASLLKKKKGMECVRHTTTPQSTIVHFRAEDRVGRLLSRVRSPETYGAPSETLTTKRPEERVFLTTGAGDIEAVAREVADEFLTKTPHKFAFANSWVREALHQRVDWAAKSILQDASAEYERLSQIVTEGIRNDRARANRQFLIAILTISVALFVFLLVFVTWIF